MELRKTVDRSRLANAALALGLTVVAISSLRKGKRFKGVLAGVGALALGYDMTAGSGELSATLDIGDTDEDAALRCAVCGEPIRPGERRMPNENNETVHEACVETVR
jgi:hypothetical protein